MLRNLVFSALVVLLPAGCSSPASRELDAYLAERRKAAMTESAEELVRTVAAIRVGTHALSFRKDAAKRQYWARYSAVYCPLPGADPQVVAEKLSEARLTEDKEIAALRPLVDADGSGFVTTEEAERFRRLVDFGQKANYIKDQEHLITTDVAPWMGLDPRSFGELAHEYEEFAALPAARAAGFRALTP